MLRGEPDSPTFTAALSHAPLAMISSVNWLEAAIVIDGRGDAAAREGFEAFFERFGI